MFLEIRAAGGDENAVRCINLNIACACGVVQAAREEEFYIFQDNVSLWRYGTVVSRVPFFYIPFSLSIPLFSFISYPPRGFF